ncbi:hypothetical protein GDO81_028198 [Engystomops pustulosus]|uniref:Uncharacterized protein n=1 Tax=Engystomops pustulosus TaxID=76066 RepID=A0AAV6ZJH2_ENGPU|nr:hypothetical protein GDO81_028198 [Engystomops pustulosus]
MLWEYGVTMTVHGKYCVTFLGTGTAVLLLPASHSLVQGHAQVSLIKPACLLLVCRWCMPLVLKVRFLSVPSEGVFCICFGLLVFDPRFAL